ncbi:hypothetical protein QRX50_36315 [Amycolatopsis carbonis]|uniref:Uncharacterized protein n=1 Tax=Amycolatopsis carbonis TaxID=715471 RepID=A0A9Y2MVF9_9PSEU|nr:hypothetical protein [Amycolatopsis sp. 2-15]WIX76854.1 hypothetical protein QRX50_36315 [Amycolatopsis sp. 2-15]
MIASERDAAVRECEALGRDADERARHGAGQLTAMLAAINPILRPAQNN